MVADCRRTSAGEVICRRPSLPSGNVGAGANRDQNGAQHLERPEGVSEAAVAVERRNHRQRADTLRRVTGWISKETSPVRQVPADIVHTEAGQRILKRLALRGLVRRVTQGWTPTPSLIAPATLHPVNPGDPSASRPPSSRQAKPIRRERRNLPALQCPRCHRIGFVRHENVVSGVEASRNFFCGSCNHTWNVKDQRER